MEELQKEFQSSVRDHHKDNLYQETTESSKKAGNSTAKKRNVESKKHSDKNNE